MELNEILTEIENRGFDKIAVQVPAGLKKESIEISRKIKELNKDPIIISSPSFGACDLAYPEALKFNCDCLIHVGHSKFYRKGMEEKIPTYYYEKKFEGNSLEILKENLGKIKENKIGLVATIQHLHELKEMKEFLEENGKIAIIGKKGIRTEQEGQILGCDVSSAEKIHKGVDAFIFVGSGQFHPIKLSELGKKVYQLNPYLKTFETLSINTEKIKQKEILKLLKYKDEKQWGIILSSKEGQFSKELAEEIKKILENKGKEVFLFIGNRILESDLIGFGIKIFINTACPRLSDDFKEVCVINPWVLKYLE